VEGEEIGEEEGTESEELTPEDLEDIEILREMGILLGEDVPDWTDPVNVTAAYQSASKTVTVTFETTTKKAKSYKIVNTATNKAVVTGITVTGTKAPYKATAKIEGLADGTAYDFQIIPVNGKKTGTVTNVHVVLSSNFTWKTTVPDLANPVQNDPGEVELTWTGKNATFPEGAESAIAWKILMDGADVSENASVNMVSAGTWSAVLTNVSNGKHKFQVHPTVTYESTYAKGEESSESLTKTLSGKKSKAMSFEVADDYEVRWDDAVNITDAKQTGEGAVTIKFNVDRAADSYTLYRITKTSTGAKKAVKTGITLKNGAASVKVTGLKENEKKITTYTFAVVPVLNGKEAEVKQWVKVRVFKYAWTTEVPTLKLKQTSDHMVQATASIKTYLGDWAYLQITDNTTKQTYGGGFNGTSYVAYLQAVPNGKQTYTARLILRNDYEIHDLTTGEVHSEAGTEKKGKVSDKKSVTVEHFWAKKPTNMHVMQMDDMQIAIRFQVKDVLWDSRASFQVTDITNTKKKVSLTYGDYDYNWNGTTYDVTLYINEAQKAGNHTYQVQAIMDGATHYGIDEDKLEKGKAATAEFTVVKNSTVWKTAPNVTRVEQTGEKEVTIRWRSNNGQVEKYVIYEYNSSKKTYKKMATVLKEEYDEGNYDYEYTITGVSSADSSVGTKHIYVVQPMKGTGKGTYSNQKDGTVTTRLSRWQEFWLESDPIGTDHKLSFKINANVYNDSRLWRFADFYQVEGLNDETGEEISLRVPAADHVKDDDGYYYVEIEIPDPLTFGGWQFSVQALGEGEEPGRTQYAYYEIVVDYMLAPALEVNGDIGEITVNWTPVAEFPEELDEYEEGAKGGYRVYAYDNNGSYVFEDILDSDQRTCTISGLYSGWHNVGVSPVILDASGTKILRWGNEANESISVYGSRLVISEEQKKVLLWEGRSVEIPYTWEGKAIDASQLYGYGDDCDVIIQNNEDGDGGVIIIEMYGPEVYSVNIWSRNGDFEEIEIEVEAITPKFVFLTENPVAEDVINVYAAIEGSGAEGLSGTMTVTASQGDTVEKLMDGETVGEYSGKGINLSYGYWDLEGSVELTVNGETVTIPVSFWNDERIYGIEVGSLYTHVNGMQFEAVEDYGDYGLSGMLLWGRSNPNDQTAELTVPDTVEGKPVVAIKEDAFNGDEYLETIHLPDTIEVIGARAFKGCTNLANMD